MKCRPIIRKDGSVYLIKIPDMATDSPLGILEEIILEQADEIERLKRSEMIDRIGYTQ